MVSFHLYFEVQTLSDAINVVKQSLMLPSVMQGCAYGLREKYHQHEILERQSIKLYVLTHKSLDTQMLYRLIYVSFLFIFAEEYRTWEIFEVEKSWQIWQTECLSPIFYLPYTSFCNQL